MHIPTTQEVIDLKTLEAMADAKEAGKEWLSLGSLEEQFESRRDLMEWVVRAESSGWIRDNGRTVHSKALTAQGASIVETALNRRRDAGLRRQTARSRLLHWVDSNVTSTNDRSLSSSLFFASGHAWFEGEIFNEHDLSDAMTYLVDKGLLHGTGQSWGGTYHRISITHDGQECVADFDSDVGAYLAAQRQSAGTVVQVTGQNNSLALALGENSAASSSISAVNVDAALLLAQAVREARPLLDLGEGADAALEDIEQRDDIGRIQRGLQWLSGFASDSSSGALGSVLGTVALRLLGA